MAVRSGFYFLSIDGIGSAIGVIAAQELEHTIAGRHR